MRVNVLVVTGGHPFEETPFLAIFDALPGISWEHAPVPDAQDYFRPERTGKFDAIVCYDMQGFEFRKPGPPRLLEPPADYADGFRGMLEAGQGIVFLHHAMSAWPAWPLWAEVVGGRDVGEEAEALDVAEVDRGLRQPRGLDDERRLAVRLRDLDQSRGRRVAQLATPRIS